jgi:hypothetical protein
MLLYLMASLGTLESRCLLISGPLDARRAEWLDLKLKLSRVTWQDELLSSRLIRNTPRTCGTFSNLRNSEFRDS